MNLTIKTDSIIVENINPVMIARTATAQIKGMNSIDLTKKPIAKKMSYRKSIIFLIF